MPPNASASGLTQRLVAADPTRSTVTDEDATEPTQILRSNEHLANTEVSIEGTIYDISDFKHPGGEVIKFFGGNDVTVQYRMIHHRHGDKQLAKMKAVGKVVDYEAEYKFDTEFEREVKREVFKITKGRDFGTYGYFFRAFLYIAFFFFMQYKFATSTTFFTAENWYESGWVLAVAFGVAQAWIGLNVQHDANHGAASKKPWVNDLLGFGADLIGGCKWSWLAQHWTHHAYTNHADKDPDSFSSEPIFTFNDYPIGHAKRMWWHRFQGAFFLPMLGFYWLSMVFNPQIIDLRHSGAKYVGLKMENDFIVKRRKFAIALRLCYFYLNLYSPVANNGWSAVAVIMLMGVAESLTLATLFSLSHNFEMSDRDPTLNFRKTGEEVCWFKSQVETSSTYGGVVAGWLSGGLNCQVEHHLFPRMSSSWYPYIAPTVRRVCEKHGVRYVYYPWIWQNMWSTVSYMHKVGTGANWKDMMQPLSGKN